MRHYVKLLFFATLTLMTFDAISQYNPTIRSARPGQSIGPFTVGKNIFQVQTGVDVFGAKNEETGWEQSGTLHNTVIRFGLAERFEISTMVNYNAIHTQISGTEAETSGLDAWDVGGRCELIQARGVIPNVGLQVRVRLPVLAQDYQIDKLATRFMLATNQKLSNAFTLSTNWGGAWNGIDGTFTGSYTANIAFPITEKLGSYVENYGSLRHGVFETRWDMGFGYLLTNNCQVDTYGGIGSNKGTRDWFLSFGLSIRTDRK